MAPTETQRRRVPAAAQNSAALTDGARCPAEPAASPSGAPTAPLYRPGPGNRGLLAPGSGCALTRKFGTWARRAGDRNWQACSARLPWISNTRWSSGHSSSPSFEETQRKETRVKKHKVKKTFRGSTWHDCKRHPKLAESFTIIFQTTPHRPQQEACSTDKDKCFCTGRN